MATPKEVFAIRGRRRRNARTVQHALNILVNDALRFPTKGIVTDAAITDLVLPLGNAVTDSLEARVEV